MEEWCGRITYSAEETRAMDIVYLNFSKAFNTISHRIVLDKMLMYRLDEKTMR